MITALILLFGFVILGFSRRLAGGGFVTFSSDLPGHLVWAAACVVYVALGSLLTVNPIYAAALGVLAYFQLRVIPHQYAVNMGGWPTPQKKWPSFFFPTIAPATWTKMERWEKFLYDFGQLFCVGFLWGAALVLPMFYFTPKEAIESALIMAAGLPVCYSIAQFMPFSLPSVPKNDPAWGELLTGIPATLMFAHVVGVF